MIDTQPVDVLMFIYTHRYLSKQSGRSFFSSSVSRILYAVYAAFSFVRSFNIATSDIVLRKFCYTIQSAEEPVYHAAIRIVAVNVKLTGFERTLSADVRFVFVLAFC